VFLGTGAGLPMFMNIPGENYNGVYSANEFLTRVNLMKGYLFPEWDTPVRIGRRVAVVGGGNVAMDAARCSMRLGADEVLIVYRRSRVELPARAEEAENAEEEGIIFNYLTNPVEIYGDDNGWVRGMKCIRMELGEPDASGRRRPIPIEGSEFDMDVDTVIMALGTRPNPMVFTDAGGGLERTRWGTVVADEDTGRTTREGVWAGGDIVTGAATVIRAPQPTWTNTCAVRLLPGSWNQNRKKKLSRPRERNHSFRRVRDPAALAAKTRVTDPL
jgi:glutamate synthase (NADPH/NADH) small chain